MAEGFEPYHVPQQSRRDKLRIVTQTHPHDLHSSTSLLPLYDPSLLSSDLLASAHNSLSLSAACNKQQHPVSVVKHEGPNLMGFVAGIVSSTSSSSPTSSSTSSAAVVAATTTTNHHHPYMDPHQCSSLPLNPTSIHDIHAATTNPFLFTPHTLQNQLRDYEMLPFKPDSSPLTHHHDSTATTATATASTGQSLSLSLSSHHTHQPNLPLELNLQRFYGDMVTATGGADGRDSCGGGYTVPGIVGSSCNLTPNELSRNTVPLGPFTGYASILKGSRFLKPAQQLLEEFCDAGRGIYSEMITADASLMDPPMECVSACGIVDDPFNCRDGGESRRKKSRLISMLDEVYRRYKHYYQQMQAVVASFECVAGLGNAAPYANLALKTMSKHFRSLKNAITDQLQFINKGHGKLSLGKEEAMRFGNVDRGPYVQRPGGQSSGFIENQPAWRPQRGLPERAVTVLRAWLFEHFLHPYPTDTDKLMLAKQTGLSRSQVSNWFINARVRLWKPMVEEIHMLETRQAQKNTQREEQHGNKSSEQAPVPNSAVSDLNPSTSSHRAQDIPSKRSRNDLPELPPGNEEPLNLSYNSMSNHPPIGVGISMGGGNNGISLTLGLHQNNGIGLSEPFPMNAAQRFGLGLETSSEGFVMGDFEVQNRQFGRDVIGGQLVHDFVS